MTMYAIDIYILFFVLGEVLKENIIVYMRTGSRLVSVHWHQ